MKKTFLTILILLITIAGAYVLYQDLYNENDPFQFGSMDISSDSNNEEGNGSELEDSELAGDTSEPETMAALDFVVYDQDETAYNLSDFYGKPIVVNFWATWCGPCKSELPAFQNLYDEYGDKVQFLMVNLTDGAQETVSGVSDFLIDNSYTFPVYYDTDMNAAITYYVTSIPRTLFIDENGNIVASHMGAMSEATLKNYIDTILSQSAE